MKRELIPGGGYGKPPEHSRFRKGQSGNPKGRPRSVDREELSIADRPMVGAILKGAQQTVKMRDGEKVTEVSVREALVRAIQATALKGDSRAQYLLLQQLHAAEEIKAAEVRREQEWAQDYKDNVYPVLAAAKAAGEPVSVFLIHPDDIVLDSEEGYRLIGPSCEEDQKKLEVMLRYRDALLMQDVLDDRMWRRHKSAPSTISPSEALPDHDKPGGAYLFALVLDRTVPERFRLKDNEIMRRQCRYELMTKRDLLKAVYQEWRSIGVNFPRGFIFPGREKTKRLLERRLDFGRAFLAAIKDGRLDLDAICRGEFDAAAHSFLAKWS